MGKRSVRVFLALVFALLLPGSPAWAGDGAPVSMEVSTVYGDMGKFGSHIPLVITFYGQSETPFNGTVNVRPWRARRITAMRSISTASRFL